MMNAVAAPVVRLRGVRHNNLKNFDLDLPLRRLIVVTGLSGSGKSSLAFDTLFAEGQRRYVETFSPYARQFFDRMDKPQVDRIEGIPPAIAIEQRNSVKSTRSTVGTMTELCDYMKLLWPHVSRLFCRQCGQTVRQEPPQTIWHALLTSPLEPGLPPPTILVAFDLPLSDKLDLAESLALIAKQGYQRLLWEGRLLRIEEAAEAWSKQPPRRVTVVQDRLKLAETSRARFTEACEHAYHFGKGKLTVHWINESPFQLRRSQAFSQGYHCASCDLEYREPSPALFSFNHPIGACPTCRGFGRIITIDYHLALPDRSKSLAEGVVKPWQTGQGADCQKDLLRMCRQRKIPTAVPFRELAPTWQECILHGDPDYGKDKDHQWPRAWYGVKGYFRWLESKAYKMHVRVLLSRYRSYSNCPDCQGRRFQPEALLCKVADLNGAWRTLADFYQLSIEDALRFVDHLAAGPTRSPADPLTVVLNEVRARLAYLVEVGLSYLTLDRTTRSLSGGETERVNLTTCLGTRLVNTLFVLDEPSVGLHARDTARLVRILENLRDAGNSVVVVEHEASVMKAADQIIDLGPGQGEAGGHLVFQGTFAELLRCPDSLTGAYLSGARQFPRPPHRSVLPESPRLTLSGATRHNLKNLTVEIPLNRLVCLTGVSGSGKTTLAREVLLPALEASLKTATATAASEQSEADSASDESTPPDAPADGPSVRLRGHESLGRVVLVDQSALGKTPRSNPVVYIGAFEAIRELFAQTDLARQRGLSASAFSFNSSQGQCERCRGAGFEKIEMQFLSDVYIRCPECQGRRYRPHVLEITLPVSLPETSPAPAERQPRSPTAPRARPARLKKWSIADLLEATVNEAIQLLLSFAHTTPGRNALRSLQLLQEVGLGYLRLGQPINTLSGGESQRLKLVSHLAEFARAEAAGAKPTLFVFDEPTTGLHFEDVRVLLQAFQNLIVGGHSILVIEHHLDVIRSSDWVIDLGPEGGERGGHLVVAGTPETVSACAASPTGQALRASSPPPPPPAAPGKN